MTDYTWPSALIPSSSEWTYNSNTSTFVSPFTGATRTYARGGDRWSVALTFNAVKDSSLKGQLQAFLAKLRGQANRAVLPNHAYRRRGTQSADVLVNGASQTGATLNVDGATVGATLLAGDMISVGSRFHMVVADATANGSGQMALTLSPPLRTSPADNATVSVASPTGKFILSDNKVTWSNSPGGFIACTVEFVEDLT